MVALLTGDWLLRKKSSKRFVTSEKCRTFAMQNSAAFGIVKCDLSLLSFARPLQRGVSEVKLATDENEVLNEKQWVLFKLHVEEI